MLRTNLGKPSTFDLSVNYTIVALALISGIYLAHTVTELGSYSDFPDYGIYRHKIMIWQPEDITQGYGYHIKDALAKASVEWFGNHKAMPLISSLALMAAAYLFAVQLSGKKLWGVVAVGAVAASNIFRHFDTSGAYPNEWALFFILSLYLIKKKWWLNPVFFGLAVFSKALVILFIPTILVFILASNHTRNKKAALCGFYGAAVLGIILFMPFNGGEIGFFPDGFVEGLGVWIWFFMVPDFWLAVLMPLSMIMLLALSAKKIPYALPMLVGMANVAFHGSVVEGFTTHYWHEPYRYIPLIVLFGCSLGVIVEGIKIRRQERLKEQLRQV